MLKNIFSLMAYIMINRFVSKKSDQLISMTFYVSVEEAMNTMQSEETSVFEAPLVLVDTADESSKDLKEGQAKKRKVVKSFKASD